MKTEDLVPYEISTLRSVAGNYSNYTADASYKCADWSVLAETRADFDWAVEHLTYEEKLILFNKYPKHLLKPGQRTKIFEKMVRFLNGKYS